jgi:hypothetical protein
VAQTGVTKDRGKGAALELSVQRYDEGDVTVRILEADMAAALSDCFPADLVKRGDELGA